MKMLSFYIHVVYKFEMKIFTLASVSLAFCVQSVCAQETTVLYPMGKWKVVVKRGDVERKPQISHKTHELDTERSSPLSDPSATPGYHFALEQFIPQASIGRNSAFSKVNPISERGFLRGNYNKIKNGHYYREHFSSKDPIVQFLKSRQSRYVYGKINPIHGPGLVNSDYEFDGISDRAFGFCWGFSTLNRYFAYGAFFDPNESVPFAYVPNGKSRNEEWFKFYEPIIDDIMSGIPRVVPGFSNFSEFTAAPEIEFYLKLKATEAWGARAISIGSLNTFFTSTEQLEDSELNELIKDLKLKLSRGELPKILFTAADSRKKFGGTLDVHSVIVNGIHMNADGTGEIKVWDINFYFPDLIKDPKILEIVVNPETGKRELHYRPWLEQKDTPAETYRSSLLGKVRISPEDESEMGGLIRGLKSFCREGNHAHKYCGIE